MTIITELDNSGERAARGPVLDRDASLQSRRFVVTRQALYIGLWAITPLVTSLAATYTDFPNQIFVIYQLLILALGAVTFPRFRVLINAQFKWLVLLSLYALTFIIVSYFGVDFSTSLSYGVLYLPLLLLEFFLAFSVGYLFSEQRAFKYMASAAIVLMLYTMLDIYFFPDRERFVTSLNIPMAIPIFVFLGQSFLAFVCTVFLFVSIKKTVVAAGVLSLGMALGLNRFVRPRIKFIRRYYRLNTVLISCGKLVVLAVVVGAILVQYTSYISTTVGRFSESEDGSRAAIAVYSVSLLIEHFPRGIGLGGFSFLSRDVIPYETTTARGDTVIGANLHNTFMTWALEGGAPVLIIVAILFWQLFMVIYRFWKRHATRMLSATLLVWLASGVLFGMFHQWHNSGTFWVLFGFAFGCSKRYEHMEKAKREIALRTGKRSVFERHSPA